MSYKNIFPEVPDVVHFAVEEALNNLDERVSVKQTNHIISMSTKMRKIAAVLVTLLIVSSVTVTASAALRKYKLRFVDEMDQSKVEELYGLTGLTETLLTNREFSEEELNDRERLWKAYENDGLIPEKEINFISDSEEYDGKGVAFCTADGIVYLPNEALSEEELLEIIDMEERMVYSVSVVNSYGYGTDYRQRFDEMTDDEIDSLYRMVNKNHTATMGGFSRALSPDEEERHQKMDHEFKENGAFVEKIIAVVDTAEDYDGKSVAYAAVEGKYMLPDREVTDVELLQIIDMQHRIYYMFDRINREIDTGYRETFPSVE